MKTSPSSPEWSMRSLANEDPFPTYDELRKRGSLVWDPGMESWLVLSYDVCKVVESDESTYRIVPADLPDWMIDIRGGRTGLSTLVGENHKRMRRLYMTLFSAQRMPVYREKYVLPVLSYVIEKFANDGRAELFSQLAEVTPIRVILAACGMPWRDEELVSGLLAANRDVIGWIMVGHPDDDNLIRRAKLGADKFSQLILPYVLERRDGGGDDFLSQIWTRAPNDYGEIGPDDMLSIMKDLIGAAGITTMHALANVIYLFLSDPDLREAVTKDEEAKLIPFIDETLRTLGSPQWRFRKANHDVSLAGVTVKKDQLICLLHAAANRDPEHYACPHKVDLERKRTRDHLAFNVGPRTCLGVPLAMLEISECLKMLIRRFPNLRLDPSKEPPRFQGFAHRSFAPLHVLF